MRAASTGLIINVIASVFADKEMIDKRIIGSTVKETIGWDITVKNNKNTKVKIIVEDQYPVSEKKSIEVERLELSNAKLDDKTGRLTWELELEPGSKKMVNYKYSVKYPKDISLIIE